MSSDTTCTSSQSQGHKDLSACYVPPGGKGRSCVQGNGAGAQGPVCPEGSNSSQAAEPCRGQACPLRYFAVTTSQKHRVARCSDRIRPSHLPSSLCCGCSRWRVEPWSPCSDSCGGGSQTRTVLCTKGPEGRWTEVGSRHCLGTGRRPSHTRPCNQQPCARWATTHWGLVSRQTLSVLVFRTSHPASSRFI